MVGQPHYGFAPHSISWAPRDRAPRKTHCEEKYAFQTLNRSTRDRCRVPCHLRRLGRRRLAGQHCWHLEQSVSTQMQGGKCQLISGSIQDVQGGFTGDVT